MKTSDLLDDVMYELSLFKGSDGWNAQRPIVLRKLKTSVSLLDNEFRDRLRFVPNVMLDITAVGDYEDSESITTYRVPADCDPQRIDTLSVNYSGRWTRIRQGITQTMRDDPFQAGPYLAWDVIECGDIEVWPNPTIEHPVRISYYRKPNKYTDESGCIDMDETLLNLLTLDQCAPRYLPNDIDSINRKLNRHMGNIKAKQIEHHRFFKGRDTYQFGTPNDADRIYEYGAEL